MSEPASKDDAIEFVRRYGAHCSEKGDYFYEADFMSGRFLLTANGLPVGIAVWGDPPQWKFSAFAAARVNMQPTFELYRYISRWRSTCNLPAPYVIEDGGAAVMCETTLPGAALHYEPTAFNLMADTISRVGEVAKALAKDLSGADGLPFTAQGAAGIALLGGWWEIGDDRILQLLKSNLNE